MKRIIGCGNLLLQDEGVGIHLIERLRGCPLPAGVELVDAATDGLGLLAHFDGCERIVIVDSMKADGQPGDIFKFGIDDFSSESAPTTSLHEVSLWQVLQLARKLGPLAPVTIFGVQPKEIDWGMELTPEVQKSLPRLQSLVLEEINHA